MDSVCAQGAKGPFMREGKMPKKEIPKTFRIDEDFEAWLSKVIMDLDCNLSELVRTALLLSVPIIRNCPSMLRRIALEDFRSQSD